MEKNYSDFFYSIGIEVISPKRISLKHKWKQGIIGKIIFKRNYQDYSNKLNSIQEYYNGKGYQIEELFFHQ